MSARRSPLNWLQAVTVLCLLWCAFSTMVIGAVAISIESKNGNRDYIEYWAAGQLLMHGGNPYDPDATARLERPAGFNLPIVAITLSPPLLFFLIAPLGLFNVQTGAIVWSMFQVACLLAALRAIWVALGRPRGQLYLLGLCFAPVLTCFMAGQISIVLLLAIALFLQLHRTHPFFAGVALTPCAWKPQLFLPFGVVILLWVVSRKQYRVVAGVGAGLLAAAAFAALIDVHAWSQWEHWSRAYGATNAFQPNLSKMLRLLVDRDAVWLQFLPALSCCAWACWYFWSRRTQWNWMEQGLLLLILSVGCAPYDWFTDESVLLPAIVAAAYRAQASGRTLLPIALIMAISLTELFKGNWIGTTYYLWTVPAYLLWYLYATRRSTEIPPGSVLSEQGA